ncbi:MAG: GxxExxY protein [Anaerolineales bacterium]|nr:GxxExxY protein [Anaerolineales bacterium]
MTELLYKHLSFAIIGAAMEVHNVLGSGFLEAVYQAALEKELKLRGILFESKVKLPVSYKGELIGEYEADLVVDGKIVVELKSISRFNSAHEAQAIHYLTATGLQLALIINFGAGSLEYRRTIKSEKPTKKSASISEIRGKNSLDRHE